MAVGSKWVGFSGFLNVVLVGFNGVVLWVWLVGFNVFFFFFVRSGEFFLMFLTNQVPFWGCERQLTVVFYKANVKMLSLF